MNKERHEIYNKTGGFCYYCGNILRKTWHEDHVKPVIRNPYSGEVTNQENDNTANKVPACPRCNRWKSSMSVESFRYVIENLITVLNRDSPQYRMAKDYGLIEETGKGVKFYFESEESENKQGIRKYLSESEMITLGNVLRFMKDHVLSIYSGSYSERKNVENILKKLNL